MKTWSLSGRYVDFLCRRTPATIAAQVLLICIVGILAYANTFNAQFNFDDVSGILGNPVVRSADPFSDPLAIKGNRAVGDLSFALNYKLAKAYGGDGFQVAGYHGVNLLIHLINALFVYLLAVVVQRTPFFARGAATTVGYGGAIPILAALLFVSHPLQTQAVTYIVQRYTSLATMFYLASLLGYLWARCLQTDGLGLKKVLSAGCYGVALFSAVLAMKTKEISFTLPFMIILCEFLFFQGNLRKRLAVVGAFVLVAAIIPLSMIGTSGGQLLSRLSSATKVQTAMPRLDYLFTQFKVIVTYLRLLFFPVGQNLDHDFPISRSFFDASVIGSLLLLLALIALAVWLIRRSSPSTINHRLSPAGRLIAFGILWFFLALAVESSLIPIVDVMFEHRVYLPSAGFFIAIATAVVMLVDRLSRTRPHLAAGPLVVMLLVIGALVVTTVQRNRVWADETLLWQDAAAKSPNKSRPWNNLAYAYLKQRQPEKAIPALVTSIMISPGHPDAWNNIGMALTQLGTYTGRFSPTYEIFDVNSGINSIYQSEWFALAYNNLGLAYDSMGQPGEAIDSFKKSIDMNPRLAVARYNLALAYASMNEQQGVAEQYEILKTLNTELAEKLRMQQHTRSGK